MSRIHQLYVSTFLLTLIPAAAYGGYGVLPGSGNNISNYSVSKISETAAQKISRLERELLEARMLSDIYNEIINVSEEKFNIRIRKKAGTKQ